MTLKKHFVLSSFIFVLGLVVSNFVVLPSYAFAEWKQQTEAGQLTLQDLILSPDGTRLVATGGNGDSDGYVYISTDGGSTWIKQTEAGKLYLYEFAFSPDGTRLIATNNRNAYVYISTDGGSTWIKQTEAGELYLNSFIFSKDGARLIAVNSSDGYVYISTDGGSTWAKQTEAGQLRLFNLVLSLDGTRLVGVNSSDHYVYISTDGGSTWTKQTEAGPLSLYDFTFSPNGKKIVATTWNGWLDISTDGGLTWVQQISSGQHSFYDFVFSPNKNEIIASSGGDRFVYIYLPPIYVDDDYTDENNDGGHEWGIDAFSTISEGIAAAPSGGTVYVAAGTYNEEGTILINKTLNLLGPGAGASEAHITNILNANQDPILSIEAKDVKVDGFYISGGSVGISLENGSGNAVISNNKIYNNLNYGIDINESINNTISQNEIYTNGNGINLSCTNDCNLNTVGNNIITHNNIHNNLNDGIIFQQNLNLNNGNVEVSFNIITLNGDVGIRILDGTSGISIKNNTITNNENGGIYTHTANDNSADHNIISNNNSTNIGLENRDHSVFNASYNYWGASSGPQNNHNHGGAGSKVIGNVVYRPYYIDESLNTLSSNAVDPSSIPVLFSNGGSLSIPTTEGTSINSTSQVSVNEETVINEGLSSVILPAGTIITKSTGGVIDASLITANDIPISDLSGLTSGVVAEGAFQWGIPEVGLAFSLPITLNIFVGTDLNGQTLAIYRSLSKVNGWTVDGIVKSTCKVSSGFCNFKSTKASYYSVVKSIAHSRPTGSSGSSGGGSSQSQQLATLSLLIPKSATTVPSILNPTSATSITLTIKRVLKLNIKGDDIKLLQVYLNTHGFPIALTGLGSSGSETTNFGPLTKKAVIAFQKANGLTPDGVVGPKTLEKMK